MGLCQLVIRLRRRQAIDIGRFGPFAFPAGYYVYTGSAKRGLESKIARRLRKGKRVRWHIDYLFRYGDIAEVKRYCGGHFRSVGLAGKPRGFLVEIT